MPKMNIKRSPVLFFVTVFVVIAALVTWWLSRRLDFRILLVWLLAANMTAFLVWTFDKFQSRRDGALRVPEKALHSMAALGATPASFAAMEVLRHKTRKPIFRRLYVALLVIQIAVIIFFVVVL